MLECVCVCVCMETDGRTDERTDVYVHEIKIDINEKKGKKFEILILKAKTLLCLQEDE